MDSTITEDERFAQTEDQWIVPFDLEAEQIRQWEEEQAYIPEWEFHQWW